MSKQAHDFVLLFDNKLSAKKNIYIFPLSLVSAMSMCLNMFVPFVTTGTKGAGDFWLKSVSEYPKVITFFFVRVWLWRSLPEEFAQLKFNGSNLSDYLPGPLP